MENKLILHRGRPVDSDGRIETELAVYGLLDSLQIVYDRVDHEAVFTMEACEAIDRILQPAAICKNLFLCNTQKTRFYMLMILADKKFKTKDISRQICSSRLSFAPEEFMVRYLGITPGSVSVMGLMNDHDNQGENAMPTIRNAVKKRKIAVIEDLFTLLEGRLNGNSI